MAVRGSMTHYQRLGVAPTATTEQIRAAYRALARDLHPDRRSGTVGERRAAEDMAAVNDAWRVLREPDSRRRYDLSLRPAPSAGPRPSTTAPDDEDRFGWTDAPPEFGERAVRSLPWVVLLVVLAAIFVVTAFARRDTGSTDVHANDGIVTVGSCVEVVGGRSVAEVPCEGTHRVRVVTITSGALPCAVGLESYDLPSGERVCVRRT